MSKTSNISHPLKNRNGLSQRTRINQALFAKSAPIDGNTLADRLCLISNYAKHINFYEFDKNEREGEFQNIGDWSSFFKNSLPFQLSTLSKTSIDQLENEFILLNNEFNSNHSKQSLELLFEFVYNKIIEPSTQLYYTLDLEENSFVDDLLSILKSSLFEPLKSYICLYNSSANFLCISKRNFSEYMATPWQLPVEVIYAVDPCISKVKKGKKEAFLKAGEALTSLFYIMLSGFERIVKEAPDHIKESLIPLKESLQEKHQPHLALIFTFLELFEHLKSNINELGQEHLKFFYEQVLKMVPKKAVPDKAHVVFELAKHLDDYLLKKDLLLKDGKDKNKQDIQFGLDHELILDKAKIVELKTLNLSPNQYNKEYLDGIFIAPVANSLDGKGLDFKKGQPTNWPSLGSKYSKQLLEDKPEPTLHPYARIGFVLASPVLLLQEGERKIIINLDCNLEVDELSLCQPDLEISLDSPKKKHDHIASMLNKKRILQFYTINEQLIDDCQISEAAKDFLSDELAKQSPYIISHEQLRELLRTKDIISCEEIFSKSDKLRLLRCFSSLELISTVDSQLFKIWFSGEKKWLEPKFENITINVGGTTDGLKFEIIVDLESDFPAVVFYDEEVLKEKIDLKEIYPLVKIELNDDHKVNCEFDTDTSDSCCLKKERDNLNEINISPYHFLKGLTLTDTNIDVEVCGIKNLIVQNDENLQDVNKPIFPFGPRPKVGENWFVDGGANFYIGSKEIFCKNWQKFWINTTWKDKPADLHEHYKFYKEKDFRFENGDPAITALSFRFLTSVLNEGRWIKDGEHKNVAPPPIKTSIDPAPIVYETNYNPQELLPLFESIKEEPNLCRTITAEEKSTYCHNLQDKYFELNGYVYKPKSMTVEPLEPLTVNSRKGFVKLTLAGTSFQHEIFTYVLTRQMMALADLVDPKAVADALVKLGETKTSVTAVETIVTDIINLINNDIKVTIDSLRDKIINTIITTIESIGTDIGLAIANIPGNLPVASDHLNDAGAAILILLTDIGILNSSINSDTILGKVNRILTHINFIKDKIEAANSGLQALLTSITTSIDTLLILFDTTTEMGLPKEPYIPLIKSLILDYHATANNDDIDIVHLYPYENTSKHELIKDSPKLFPFFDNEGTLFIGIENLTSGGGLSLLFQLAQATADSEQDRAIIKWHYLSKNSWFELRPGFELISDDTDGLTVSGIVTIAVPDGINKVGNTIMPDNLYWIKITAFENVKAVAEIIGVHTQAAKTSARLNKSHDRERLNTALEEGSIAKLVAGDFSVKKVEQPYPSFGGRLPEVDGHFFIRVSEHLKHKDRSLMSTDFEKIILEGFPEIYKVKCISHTMGLSANLYRRDLEVAPGFVVISVIPDLTKLKSGNMQEPKVPVSLLEKIGDHLRKRTSPFARIKIMNPRFEKINIKISVRLYRGKSSNFYRKKLEKDLQFFLAPWFLGDSEKLTFGQVILFSDIVGFVERLDYVDFIKDIILNGECCQTGNTIKPLTARSIITGGNITVKIDPEACPEEKNNPIELIEN